MQKATEQQRNNFELENFGIHWSEIDEDLSVLGFFTYKNEIVKNYIQERIKSITEMEHVKI